MIKETIKQTILKHKLIQRGEHIVIGLSGGPDSVCLFHILKQLAQEMDFALYAVHVNHKFRPGDAEEDQAYVEALCEREGVTCVPFVYDCGAMAKELGLTSEEAGRKARYEAFGKVANALVQNGIPRENVKIAVAQNADDQAETVLLRLLRGTGPDGLSGIAYRRGEGSVEVIRPLLDVPRREIEAYCKEKQLSPRIDQTNLQPVYTRNKVRLQLIPYLRENFNPGVSDALLRLSRIAGQDKDYLWSRAESEYSRLLQGREPVCLNQEGLKELHPAVGRRVIMKAFQTAGLTQDITASHLEAAERLLQAEATSKRLDFPDGYCMEIRYERVYFYKKSADTKEAEMAGKNPKLRIRLIERPEEKPLSYPKNAAVFDWEKLCASRSETPEIILRRRQPGDYISLKKGRKKLQDFFVDQKVPRENRDQLLLVAAGSEILWIIADPRAGLPKNRYNEKYKLDKTTKKALMLEFVCEI
ncbi:tRNA lysidine(34) synthetase TilS [bacterium 210820-DFI.6.37]|nr:tRNA lysidine(34) synthetase TilS [bacterium 210820-DFI.6.37]